MHIRIQPWLPFTIQICLNGCEWLAQQLRRLDSRFEQHDNCVYAVANLALAQLNTQRWTRVLRAFAVRVNPLLRRYGLRPYYWSLEESEYATDVLFRDPARLQTLYPALVDHAYRQFHTRDVLRFLGHPHTPNTGEVTTRVQRRVEGVRVKHWVHENTLKMYDKLGHVLRVETTVNHPRRFMVYRATAPGTRRHWVRLRKGIADIPRPPSAQPTRPLRAPRQTTSDGPRLSVAAPLPGTRPHCENRLHSPVSRHPEGPSGDDRRPPMSRGHTRTISCMRNV